MKHLKIVLISDTHNKLSEVKLPKGDILIHAGDYSFRGDLPEVIRFNQDLGAIKHLYPKGIFVTLGNHDGQTPVHLMKQMITNATVLVDEAIEIEGIKFWFSPYSPEFCNWYYSYPRNSQEAKDKWSQIPDNTSVLITHSPAHGTLDVVKGRSEHLGCEVLRDRIAELKDLQLHVCGHIHSAQGVVIKGKLTSVNASILDEGYKVAHKPMIFKYKLPT